MALLRVLTWLTGVFIFSLTMSCGQTVFVGGGGKVEGKRELDAQGRDGTDIPKLDTATGTDTGGDIPVGPAGQDGGGTGADGTATAGTATAGDTGGETAGTATGGTAGDAGQITAITLDPASADIFIGQKIAFKAIATYEDQTTADITDQATFTTSDQTILAHVTDDNVLGTFEGRGAGSAQVTAQLGDKSALAAVNVSADSVSQLAIDPGVQKLPLGAEFQFQAIANYAFAGVSNVTAEAEWSLDKADLASVGNSAGVKGKVTAKNTPGAVQLMASFGGKTATANIEISDLLAERLEIEPVDHTIPKGEKIQYKAVLIFPGNLKVEVTELVAWSIKDGSTNKAEFADAARPGLLTAKSAGEVIVMADYNNAYQAEAKLRITDGVLEMVQLIPASFSMPVMTSRQMQAMAKFSDGTMIDITDIATYASGNESLAKFDPAKPGKVDALAVGSVALTASYKGKIGQSAATINAAVLQALVSDPAMVKVPAGLTQAIKINGVFDNDSQADVTAQVQWKIADPTVGQILGAGTADVRFKGLKKGTTTVTATYGGKSVDIPAEVIDAVLDRVEVKPATLAVEEGQSKPLKAWAYYSDGTTLDITDVATWESADANTAKVANIANNSGGANTIPGLVTAIKAGKVVISAEYMTKIGVAEVTVTAKPVVNNPAAAIFVQAPGGAAQTQITVPQNTMIKVSWIVAYIEKCDITGLPLGNLEVTANGDREVKAENDLNLRILCRDGDGKTAEGTATVTTTVPMSYLELDGNDAPNQNIAKGYSPVVRFGATGGEPCEIFFAGAKAEGFTSGTRRQFDADQLVNVVCTDAAGNTDPNPKAINVKVTDPAVEITVNGNNATLQPYPRGSTVTANVTGQNASKCDFYINDQLTETQENPTEGTITFTKQVTVEGAADTALRAECFDRAPGKDPVRDNVTLSPVVPNIVALDINGITGKDEAVFLQPGSSYTVTWTVVNADSCELTLADTKVADNGPYETVLNAAEHVYKLTCIDAQNNKDEAMVTVKASDAVVDLFINDQQANGSFPKNTELTITWTTENVENCALTINDAAQDISGTQVLYTLGDAAATVRLSCTDPRVGQGGTVITRTLVAISTVPSVKLLTGGADKETHRGDHDSTVTFTFSSENADSCVFKIGNEVKSAPNNTYVHTIDGDTSAQVTCVDAKNNSATDSVAIEDIPIVVGVRLTEQDPDATLRTTLALQASRQYFANLLYSDDSVVRISANQASFLSTNSDIVSFASTGVATGVAEGSASIYVKFQNFESVRLTLTVAAATGNHNYDLETNPGKLDLIWVVDNSHSMEDNIAAVKRNLADFLTFINDRADIRFILLSMSDCDPIIETCQPVTLPTEDNQGNPLNVEMRSVNMYINSGSALAAAAIATCEDDGTEYTHQRLGDCDNGRVDTFGNTMYCGVSDVPVCGTQYDLFLPDTLRQKRYFQLKKGELGSHLREDSQKAYVFVTDSALQESQQNLVVVGDQEFVGLIQISVGEFTPVVFGISGVEEAEDCVVNPITGDVADLGPALGNLATATGGSVFDICDLKRESSGDGQVAFFETLSKELVVVANSQFRLNEDVGEILTIAITQDGQAILDFEVSGNLVSVNPKAINAEGGAIQIEYTYVPKSE